MPEHFVPRPRQRIIKSLILNVKRLAIWAWMGKGKTAAVLDALEGLNLVEDVYPVLVIAMYRVAQSVWAPEAAKWDRFCHLKFSIMLGGPGERRLALRKKAEYYTINFENVPWLIQTLNGSWPFKTIVVDEATKLRGFRLKQGTSRARALSKVCHLSDRFIELTGTPAPSGYKHLWGQAWFLDFGKALGLTYTAFMDRWFKVERDEHTITPFPHSQKEIDERLKGLCFSLDGADDKVDVPEFIPVPVTLPYYARILYKDMEKKFFVEIKEKKIEAFNSAVKSGKLLQLANGAIYTDDKGNWESVHDEKIKALESIIEEANGAPILTAYHFKSDLVRLRKAFPDAKVLDKNPKTIEDWNAGRIGHLLLHPASAGHGLSLQYGGHRLAFFGLTWDLELFLQVIERIGPERQRQSGFNRTVYIYLIMAENTLDYTVRERLLSKKSVQDCLLEAMSKYNV